MHRKPALAILFAIAASLCFGQKGYGFEQDYYLRGKSGNSLAPCVYYQTGKGWYGQMRYNYEEEGTVSFQLGKTFSQKGRIDWTVTPLAGLLTGRFNGYSAGFQAEAQAGVFSLYSSPEYCQPFSGAQPGFFYNWAEASVQPTGFFYGGVAVQHTAIKNEGWFAEPGLLLGITAKGWELPLYFFKPPNGPAYWVMGVHWRLPK